MKVAILMSVYNRKEKTMECLDICHSEIESFRSRNEYEFNIFLTEDNCTDGTAEAIAETYPDVKILHGDGNLFWNRGMIKAWNEAVKSSPDFYLWLNDDTMIFKGALSVLLETSSYLKHKAIVVGTAADSSGKLSYGGKNRSDRLIVPDKEIPVSCYTFNGNLVLVPSSVYRKLGTMDIIYSHSFGDFDYGIRADKAGITSVVAPGILARCDRNPGFPKWRDASLPLNERYAAIMSPKGRPFKEQFIYDCRYKNILWAAGHFMSLNMKVLFPKK